MRPACRLLAAALLLAAGSAAPGRAEEALDEPVKLVRTLQLLQDQIAHGTLESEDARRTLIDAIGARLLAAGPETWNNLRNVHAALLYVLSGGNPAVLKNIPVSGEGANSAPLIAAVRAYATGSEEEAKKLWTLIELDALPAELVAPAALAKATLLMKDDPGEAMQFVDVARLESPGTLVEEAAVRRGIEIAAKLGDAERFEFFAIRYASRFPRSMYAEAFRRRFSEFYIAIASEKDGKPVPELQTILASLSEEDSREMYLEIARLAVVEGKVALGKSAADNAAAMSAEGTVEMRRAQLYRAAALTIVDNPVGMVVELGADGEGELPPGDRELFGAVLAVVDQIQRWPVVVGNTEPPPVEGLDASVSEGTPDTAPDIIARAQEAVLAAKRLLADAGT